MLQKRRIVSLDFIRLFACICILVTHFTSDMSGWVDGSYTYSNFIFPPYYLNNKVYIGGIGVSIFFMLTGATLMMTYKEGNLLQYYKRRFLALYPLFWTTFAIVSTIDFFIYKTIGYHELYLLFYSLIGMDGYLGAMNVIPFGFYKVGEWFFGCLVCLYAFFPLLYYCLKRKPVLTVAGVAAIYITFLYGVYGLGWTSNGTEFFIKFPELLLGMFFIKYRLYEKPNRVLLICCGCAFAGILLSNIISSPTLTTLVSMGLCGILFWLAEKVKNDFVNAQVVKLAALSYPVYLIHHWLICRIATCFNLAAVSKRDLYFLFIVYSVICFIAAHYLTKITNKILRFCTDAFQAKQSTNTPSTKVSKKPNKLTLVIFILLVAFPAIYLVHSQVSSNQEKMEVPAQSIAEYHSSISDQYFENDDLVVVMQNTGNASWKMGDNIRCTVLVDGTDINIRADLQPDQIVHTNESAVFYFSDILPLLNETAEIVMLQETVNYFEERFPVVFE